MGFELNIEPNDWGDWPQPDLRPIKESGDVYRLYQSFYINVDGLLIGADVGLVMDGASVPKAAWSLGLARDGMHRAASFIHDILYINKGVMPGRTFTRKEADKLFRDMLEFYGIKSWHVWMAYRAVRLGGGKAWND